MRRIVFASRLAGSMEKGQGAGCESDGRRGDPGTDRRMGRVATVYTVGSGVLQSSRLSSLPGVTKAGPPASPHMSQLHAVLVALLVSAMPPQPVPAQSAGSAIGGTVRSQDGVPLAMALVTAAGRRTATDSLGRYELLALTGDSASVRIRRIGLRAVDTLIHLRSGTQTRLDVILHSYDRHAELRKAEAADAASGRVDSSARGLLRPTPANAAPALTFADFGLRFLEAVLDEKGAGENVVVSPVSAGLALGLALQGARGRTEAALSKLLGTDTLDRATVVQRGRTLMAAATGRSDVELRIANAVWVDSVAVLTRTFGAAAAAWDAPVMTLDLDS